MSVPTRETVRALGLCSGGLDSMVAAMVLRKQGIDVHWITFETPFFGAGKARKAARMLGVPLTVEDITPRYLQMLRNPPCGYGKNMNPCMDCHALMFRLAGEKMRSVGCDFLFSGEVLGQRPMSQTKPSLRYVEKHSGQQGWILRPLSAARLPETIPEQMGLVDRSRLLGLSGRSRKPQMELARQLGITEYPAPAGGCLLTDKGYSARLRDLFEHTERCSENELHLLKHGRHFRLDDRTKAVVGRTRKDNEKILTHVDPGRDAVLNLRDFPGPVVVVPRPVGSDALQWAAALCAGYGKAPADRPAAVNIEQHGENRVVEVEPLPPDRARDYLIR
ncbi:MAG: tRNA 4-thiouridine(8) synthase ThiI [Desulfobacteraceae bacterium]|jgi:tRNA U34 2-thiouridine synthase MnmA/TrmU|nr:tRNA 4-thiouridine(8) synthase ThiI [Desulfobacteraceae bacterium]